MSDMTIETVNYDLSMRDPETGRVLTGNVYRVSGINRDLSIGELVMAICLNRAVELESQIVDKMNVMANTTLLLEAMTQIQEAFVNEADGKDPLANPITVSYPDKDGNLQTAIISDATSINNFLLDAGIDESQEIKIGSNGTTSATDIISGLSSIIDSKNSVNQADMIELQSLTNKRDQSYDLITNVLKSLFTTLSGNVNNL